MKINDNILSQKIASYRISQDCIGFDQSWLLFGRKTDFGRRYSYASPFPYPNHGRNGIDAPDQMLLE